MNRHERTEMEISALLDGELCHGEILALVDELVASAEARGFYRQARLIDRALGAGERLPVELWQRIEAAAGGDWSRPAPGLAHRFLRVAATVAAAAVLVVTGWLLAPASGPVESARDLLSGGDVVTVELAGDRGLMDDRRFIELTTELLRADPRYHRTMNEIMTAVTDRSLPREGSGEGLSPLADSAGQLVLASDSETREWD